MRSLLAIRLVHVHELLCDDLAVGAAGHLRINGLKTADFGGALLLVARRGRLVCVGGLGHLKLFRTLWIASATRGCDVADNGHVDFFRGALELSGSALLLLLD